jgi:diadenosine tetraphosphatase ApaH/serine/threonine PP2A family protein phosphatase
MASPVTAIVSDVHGNRSALEAVLEDSRLLGATELWCLGDIVGYGPEPVACLAMLRERAAVIIRGNHEQAVLDGPYGFNPLAAAAIHWTRREFGVRAGHASEPLRFLASLPERSDQLSAVLVHGSPAQPLDEYLFQEDTLDHLPRNRDYSPKLARSFRLIDRPCFVGHTHVPGVIGSDLTWTSPADCAGRYDTRGAPCIVNVGSVGQPRDGDTRASYALFDGQVVTFRRVAYDLAATARAIRATPELPPALARRLEEGW